MTLRPSTRTAWVIFIVLVVLLVAGTTMPGEIIAGIEDHMWRKVPWSNLAHYTLFMMIGLCPVYGEATAAAWRIALVGILLAVLTEFLQSLVPGRHPELQDLLIDLSGTTTALMLLRLLRQPLTVD